MIIKFKRPRGAFYYNNNQPDIKKPLAPNMQTAYIQSVKLQSIIGRSNV